MQFEFSLKTNIKMGETKALDLGEELKALGLRRIGVVIDPNVAGLPYVKKVLSSLKKEGCEQVTIWRYDIKGEPDYDSLDRIKLLFCDKKATPTIDCFVAIGGGSVIDFAKGLATLMTNKGNALTYRGFPTSINPSLPTVALPTVAGSGSEVTYNAVFTDTAGKKKLGINTRHNFPVLAILDPTLTLSCPKNVTVSSGTDGMVHTLESYVASKANALTRVFAKEAFALLFNNLPKVIKRPKDIKLRAKIQLGSYLAGISLMNSGSGPAGALSYPLGVHFKVPHGIAGGIFLPHIVEHNVKKGYDYSELYDLIEGQDKSLSKKRKSRIFSQKLFHLCQTLGIPSTLRKVGVSKDTIDILLEETERLDKAFAQNPIPFSVNDGKNLLTKLLR